jgi:hypothetical protein
MLCKIRQHVTVQELSGSLGDLGTFLPLVVSSLIAVEFVVLPFRCNPTYVHVPAALVFP